MVEISFYMSDNGVVGSVFRYQNALNFYLVEFSLEAVRVRKMIAGTAMLVDEA